MKSVLTSIRPEWCEKIVNGDKTIELRKSKPKCDVPFRCYIYCTKNSNVNDLLEYHLNSEIIKMNGKVIGEFMCDHIYETDEPYLTWLEKATCVDMNKIAAYKGNSDYIYGWHISNLIIYDEPKALGCFYCPLPEKDLDEGNYNLTCGGEVICMDYPEGSEMCAECPYGGAKPLKRPPQSWCYVEKQNIDELPSKSKPVKEIGEIMQ